ncbi:MAG: tryptophan synthase subunit alpha [Micavibrio sp.]|nr:tryptophan synthase subunit alpha [Micavibrio sp.]|tara:strand:+ start:1595 stop:2386 length:792 start_codon:yes stop_codon:yes gene_type:complete
MSRIEKTLSECKSAGRKALITFITAGDPDKETSLEVLKSLPDAGADIIELGMPFADPGADGPVIQQANQRALNNGANMVQTLEMVRAFRKENQETPIVLMGYFNPVLSYGLQRFTHDAHLAGIDGLIIVDLPPEEDVDLRAQCQKCGIDLIRLITPTSDRTRLPVLLDGVSGFLYYVSITGVTGTAKPDLNTIKPHIDTIREYTDLPVAIGFGIKTPEDAAYMGQISDAVVVGSAIVNTMNKAADGQAAADVSTYVKTLAKAL